MILNFVDRLERGGVFITQLVFVFNESFKNEVVSLGVCSFDETFVLFRFFLYKQKHATSSFSSVL